jgi:hypothetical protein
MEIPPNRLPFDPLRSTIIPDKGEIFSLHNDDVMEQVALDRLRQNNGPGADDKNARFPVFPPIGGGVAYEAKTAKYAPREVQYNALYVIHRRLHFEELNAERYGWDLGMIQPLVSAMYFYKDVLLFPSSVASGFCQGFWDTSAGKCLPGSPTPYSLYPQGLSITGTAAEGVFWTGLAFIVH